MLKQLQRTSYEKNQAQLFIETPYRNNNMLADICTALNDNTRVCVACDITLPTEYIKTKTVAEWKNTNIDLHKRPAIFVIQKD
jgi:16S rRNA (cytidine1402-2'-O)-methyltransferase